MGIFSTQTDSAVFQLQHRLGQEGVTGALQGATMTHGIVGLRKPVNARMHTIYICVCSNKECYAA